MTRNNKSELTHSPSHSTTNSSYNDDSYFNLPDLSNLKDNEKQHILNVLGRDEILRSKHLSRFMQLRKEVNELEHQPQSTSTSVCARCQTPFGYIFNTGAMCPKCGAKVCKQCRLMYNVNDNGWLCQLCCKQMQLLSYSGEWIYALRSNLRKDSLSGSEIIRKSLSPTVSIPNLSRISSSDTETEDVSSSSFRINSPFQNKEINQKNSNNNNNINRMIVQTIADEDKLNSIKRTVEKRPFPLTPIQSMPSRFRQFSPGNMLTGASSDDVDSLYDHSTNHTDYTSSPSNRLNINDKYLERSSSTPISTHSPSTKQNLRSQIINNKNIDRRPVDCASVTSSEWGTESERGELNLPPQDTSIKRKLEKNNSKQSLSSHKHLSDSKQSLSSRKHISGSIQSIRDVVNRIPKPHLSRSRTSLKSEQKPRSETLDTTSSQILNEPSPSDSRTNLSIINDSKTKSNTNIHGSSNSLVSNESVQEQNITTNTIQSPNNSYRFNNNNNTNKQTLGEKFGSVGNLDKIDSDDDDDDDIDGKFEKAKLGFANRAASCMDMRGSQLSINSALSEKKAHYDLDISGTIELKLTYSTITGALDILICNCKNLTPAKKNQKSDPYVKVYLLPDRSKNSKRKTSTKKNTIDPVFDEKLRYHVTKQEFETRVLSISVWSQGVLGQNDFLGEIHIPLSNCTLDKIQEHQLLAQKQKNDLTPTIEPTVESAEIQFQLTFIENPNHKEVGTLQVHYIEGKAIFYGKRQVDAICKGVLMPDHVKRKLPAIRKGPTPKWEVPMRWDGVRRNNLENSSVEISIWSQERFRKTMIGFVRLNLARGHFDNKSVKWSDATKAEKSAWETFLRRPTDTHHFRLPLRPATIENK